MDRVLVCMRSTMLFFVTYVDRRRHGLTWTGRGTCEKTMPVFCVLLRFLCVYKYDRYNK